VEYPSFIWGKGVGENRAGCPILQGNVLIDLKMDGILHGLAEKYALIPCSRDEIAKRQALFRAMERNPAVGEALLWLKDSVLRLKKTASAYQISETEKEKALYFAVFVTAFLETCTRFSELSGKDSIFSPVSDFFKGLLAEPFFSELSEETERCFASRGDYVRIKVEKERLIPLTNPNPMKERSCKLFDSMGIPEELPQNRVRRRPQSACVDAYEAVYPDFVHRAESLYGKYGEALLGEQLHTLDLILYGEEITFIQEAWQIICRFRDKDYPLCYPVIAEEPKILADGLVDAALLCRDLSVQDIVPNGVDMARERDGEKLNFYLLTGANGGGKTTYLRSVGSMVLLFLLGLPVTAAKAEIYPFRTVFTHFPANERFEGSGRFVDEERRVKAIKASADEESVALFNETYSGTDEKKSEEYSRGLAEEMWEKGVFGLFVTHIHNLTGGKLPVLCAEVDETDENKRTYKIRRARTTNSSYAYDILKKYGLDRESLEQAERREDHGSKDQHCL